MGGPGGSLRELRPRAGRSPWRCIYKRIGDVFVIGAVAPEAMKDKAGFERAVVAVKVIAYRAEHSLSQTALAGRLKMSQPAVARLESGEHNPTFPTLMRLSDALGIELAIDIAPTGQEPRLIGKRARRNALEAFDGDGCSVVVAAA